MYQLVSKQGHRIKVISAWKYPGITKPGDPIPIPPDILEEIIQQLKSINMGKERFEGLISESLKKLPYRFLNKLKNSCPL